ncbi:MAG: winged helix-turn-helix domain-containing protein [Verrucomicrobiales bacterium]|nr:winged helix-turn-helix domain-containing protein [Verrucomicrobiales bacterium]
MDMTAVIFNSELVATLMLSLYQRHEVYASGLAREHDLTLSAVQKQLTRFERAGLLTARAVGKTRVYTFNSQNPYVKPLTAMLKITGENMSPAARKKMFPHRQRPASKNQAPRKDPPLIEVDEKIWLY